MLYGNWRTDKGNQHRVRTNRHICGEISEINKNCFNLFVVVAKILSSVVAFAVQPTIFYKEIGKLSLTSTRNRKK